MFWQTYDTPAQQAASLTAHVAMRLQTAISQHAVARFAVPGGSTPKAFLSALAQQPVAWEQVILTLTDERQVPPDHARANTKLLREQLSPVWQRLRFVPLYDTALNVTALSHQVSKLILPLDVAVIGMGADGHFASLFPGMAGLVQALDPNTDAVLVDVKASESIPEARVSLTLAALLSATQLHLLITGEAKRQVIERAAAGDTTLPVQALLAQAGDKLTVHWTHS